MVADTLAQTKGLGDTIGTLPSAAETTEGIKQGMTLIDRFYDGGNMARQGVADILVTVLDQVIGRMRQRNANAEATIERVKQEIVPLDRAIARIEVKLAPLRAEQHGQSALLGSAPARPLCPLRARLAALGSSALPE